MLPTIVATVTAVADGDGDVVDVHIDAGSSMLAVVWLAELATHSIAEKITDFLS